MPPEDINFQTFFAAKIKDRGVSLKKLAEATGITPAHLEAMVHGRFDDLPSAPYVRGYLIRLGKVLDFDGEEWWEKIRKEELVQNSGPADALPNNRFIRQSPRKFIWMGIVALLVIVYLAFQIPIIFGRPQLSVAFPNVNPYTTASSTLTFQGVARGADSLFLGNGLSGDAESITIASDGSWRKSVLLQTGMNTFQITAKKLLGSETSVTEQILYQGAGNTGTGISASSSTVSSTIANPTGASSTQNAPQGL
jgi:plasmid maintenance system antidote protein VapI